MFKRRYQVLRTYEGMYKIRYRYWFFPFGFWGVSKEESSSVNDAINRIENDIAFREYKKVKVWECEEK